jgi:hypothetical protein
VLYRFAFAKNQFLYHTTDEVIQNLLNAGIIDQLEFFHQSVCYRIHQKPEWEPYDFSLDDLLFGFYIWLENCVISLIVMASEWSRFHGKRTTIRFV